MSDPPLNAAVRDPSCIVLHPTDPQVCKVDRDLAQPEDPMLRAASTMGHSLVHPIDLTDYFCDDASCYAVIGGMPVYFDPDHLNRLFAKEFAPLLADAIGRTTALG
ncbi:SGNH hydrolase domain-containing protein [Oerskovia sp. M15]